MDSTRDRLEFTRQEKAAIARFLCHYKAAAEKARDRTKAAAKLDPSGSMAKNHAYWRNVSAGCAWMLGHLDRLRTGG